MAGAGLTTAASELPGPTGRLAFLGTPDAAVPFLHALVAAGHEVVHVVTQPDRRRGRGAALVPSPVKVAAEELGLPVSSRVLDVVEAGADLGVVVAFGRIIRPEVLEQVPMVNVHFSLLPRWRGAAPVERAILAGDTETGVALMEVAEELDSGGVYAERRIAIGDEETADELRARLVAEGVRLMLDGLASGLAHPVDQTGDVTYAAKIEPDELRIDWAQGGRAVHRLIRLGSAWTTFRGRRLRILRARFAPVVEGVAGQIDGICVAAGDGSGVELVEVQPEGKGAQAATAWRNGARPVPGERLE